ncbi:39S ribosomal protein L54, mitochondrial-like [Centruroides sculpturatus]|uniref:39S ribosomal protein L54, mitochondrial-like n=1 Tax=Centruroides sculpturatus TaxID=218467 RepID=UPI000C6CDBE5|nr:39S ribosomal protein L54, mitochondrial-like [Centruroides sculpturatus]
MASRLLYFCRNSGCNNVNLLLISTRTYAKKLPVAQLVTSEPKKKKRFPVETDPEKLVNYVCGSNIYKEGEDIKLSPDSEYPEWIWKMNLGEDPELDELDPNTLEYWEKLHKVSLARQNRLLKMQRLPRLHVGEIELKKLKKLKELRFRALAGIHYDPGEIINEKI